MLTRRKMLSSLAALALMPAVTSAADNGFMDLIANVKDRSERDYYEKHRDDARWDGKYYYDKKSNKRYTRDEWRNELGRRYKDDQKSRSGKGDAKRVAHDDRKDRKDQRDPKKDPKRKDDRKDNKKDPKRDSKHDDKRDDRRDDRRK